LAGFTVGPQRSRRGLRARGPVGLTVSLLAVAVSVTLAVPGHASPRDQVEAARSKLAGIQRDFRQSQAHLRATQDRLNQAVTELAEAEFAYQATIDEIKKLRGEIGETAAHYDRISAQLEDRAVQGFIEGSTGEFGFLLDSSSFSDFSDRLQFLDAVGDEDSELATAVANERAELEMRRAALSQVRAKQADLLERRREKRAKVAAAFGAAEAARDQLDAARAEAVDLVAAEQKDFRQWKEAQAELAAEAAGGGGGAVTGPGPFQACPVPGGGISNSFGAPRVGHLHAGVDIFAPVGAEIRAPFAGTAIESSNSIGGLAVSVTGSQGYVYNAHLSSVAKTGPVNAGEVIGYVGTSGNASGTSPHDHFEWHPSSIPSGVPTSPYGYATIGDAVNPYPYLVAVC
jgi:murein DD-endopeptidase MepM/ murein hydrolase activator NlpD